MQRDALIPLTPLAVSIGLAAVTWLCARSRHLRTNSEHIYKFPLILACISALVAFLFLGLALLPGARGAQSKLIFMLELSPFCVGAATFACYLLRYRVTVKQESITVRSLRNSCIAFSEIADTDLLEGRRREFVVYLRGGKRVRFSGLLQDFDSLTNQISDRLIRSASANTASAYKLADHARAAAGNRRAIWIMACGFGLLLGLVTLIHALGIR